MKSPHPNVCLACELGLCPTAHVDQVLKAKPAITNVGSILCEDVHNQAIKTRTTVSMPVHVEQKDLSKFDR